MLYGFCFRVKVYDSGFGFKGLGFRVLDFVLGFWVYGSGFRDFGCMVQGLGLKFHDLWFRVYGVWVRV